MITALFFHSLKKRLFHLIAFILLCHCFSCQDEYKRPVPVEYVKVENIYLDETLSVRALEFDDEYLYYGSSNHIGKRALSEQFKIDLTDLKAGKEKDHIKFIQNYEGQILQFRAIAEVKGDLFAISVANPARLFKISRKAKSPKLVYEEQHEKVFYDSMAFWNDLEGIVIGDPKDNCISIIITRDGGNTWNKLSCDVLPESKEGEAAFAASDTNIAIVGEETWMATGGKASRIYYSADKGKTWDVIETPIIQGKETTGMYSVDFYDAKNGFAIGGDYTKPKDAIDNKIKTTDGGKTWTVVSNGNLGYRSCVQYIPNSNANELVAVGFNGIDYSSDAGDSWKHISNEGFYTLRFVNDSIAYAGGDGRISKLTFR